MFRGKYEINCPVNINDSVHRRQKAIKIEAISLFTRHLLAAVVESF